VETFVHDDGRVEFGRWQVEDPLHGMNLLCETCDGLLAEPEALLQRLMQVYAVFPN
jgi:hypothetical protein